MKQQQQQQEQQARLEEYRSAQRAAVESVYVGRATAEAVQHQGEQLRRADRIADDTQYKLDRATRLLKGMTWSGRVANWFTPEVKAPASLNQTSPSTKDGLSLETYDALPPDCQGAAQAIRNYHANVSVLMQCETEEQKVTLRQICDEMHRHAVRQLALLTKDDDDHKAERLQAYTLQLQGDLDQLRHRQLQSQAQIRGLLVEQVLDGGDTADVDTTAGNDNDTAQKEELFGRKPASSSSSPTTKKATSSASPAHSSSSTQQQQQQQDAHLAVLSASLGELGSIANNLNAGLTQQSKLMNNLDTKAEQLHETSQMVGRRADRLVQTKSWTPAKAVLVGNFGLRHVATGKYLACLHSELFLVNQFNPTSCTFGVHQRSSAGGAAASSSTATTTMVGLQNRGNRKWMGQSFLTGALQCAAGSLGRREEFQLDGNNNNNNDDDHPWSNTRLLCASAGWGQGGYLRVHPATFAVSIGGATVADSKNAARWCFIRQEEEAAADGRRTQTSSPSTTTRR